MYQRRRIWLIKGILPVINKKTFQLISAQYYFGLLNFEKNLCRGQELA